MATTEADIAIIGLGPAGAAAAAEAASEGARVVAFDRKREAGQPVQCAEFVPALIGLAVDDLAAARVQDIEAMMTFVEDAPADLTEDFPGKMIDRAAFDAQLCERAVQAGAACRFSAKIAGVDEDGGLRLATGDLVRAKIIISADGPGSCVGRAIGSVNAEIVESRQATVDLLAPHQATDIFLSHDIPGGYGWLFPKGGLANIGLGVASDAKALLKPALEELHARLVSEGRVGEKVYGYTGGPIPVGGLLRAYGKIRGTTVFLAGDAAGLANPVTGAGIASAVMSGALAGEAALAALAGDAQAGENYQGELEALFGPALERARRHRQRLAMRAAQAGRLSEEDLRSGWIAYPEYWAGRERADVTPRSMQA